MKSFLESKFVKEVSEITNNMYRQGWDERNGGNVSYLIDEEFVKEYFPVDKFIRDIPLGFKADEITRNKGTQFDPKVADVFLNILENEYDKIIDIENKY